MARQKHAGAQPDWRRFPIGVEVSPAGTPHARVWAPARRRVDVIVENPDGSPAAEISLERDGGGYFSGGLNGVNAGARYRYRLDGGSRLPDPASRFQPDGPHGPSQIVDPRAFAWSDGDWPGVSRRGQVIYELHIGTFTRGGTFRSAIQHLPDLVDLGVTVVEIMPIAEFAGRFGWGYDGVDLFAPYHLYGTPDDLRALIDAAHRLHLGVILDVVYNHFGPDGNYLKEFAPRYFSGKDTECGEAINFDGDDSRSVREFFTTNAAYWINEFHFDGLRHDATQQIFDESEPHILFEVATAVRAAAGGRATIVVAENEPQHAKLVR
ncbi:MAG TPA: alpha-amylase family glycosyl hydrolase, partial [Gemmatimonadaceae bacterium]